MIVDASMLEEIDHMRYEYSTYKDISHTMDYLMIGNDSQHEQLGLCDRLSLSHFNQMRFIHICSHCMHKCLVFHISHMPCLEKVLVEKFAFSGWGDETHPSSFCIKDCPVLTVFRIDGSSFPCFMKCEFSGYDYIRL